MTDISGIEISDSVEDLACYGFDASCLKEISPSLIAWPKTTEEVSRLVRYACDRGMSIVPRGAGTAMTGSAMPKDGNTLIISLEKMRKLLDINTKNMTALVEPGILNSTLQRDLHSLGLFYPPDPSSMNFCTIGGNVATNAGGPRAIKYGVTRDYVMELEAVLPDGTIICCGGKTHKRVVGYDLKNLLVGSEGTLAIVTKIRLKVLPSPEDVATLLVTFADIESAAYAIDSILISGIIPRTLEFIDSGTLRVIEDFKPGVIPPDANALLLLEIDGNAQSIKKEAERIVSLCSSSGGQTSVATDAFSRDIIWEVRRSISPALYQFKPAKTNEDIVVPRDKIPELLSEVKKISQETSTDIFCFGHAGDGNIHVNIMTDSKDEGDRVKIERTIRRLFETTLRLGGALSGEHGIGITKAPYLNMELPDRQIALMRGIKQVFDPEGRLNPGKIFI
jgi:glycolate oxidase